MKAMNIVVTGGAGFIGSRLCSELCKTNNVVSIDNYSSGTKDNHVSKVIYFRGDAKDISKHVPKTFKPDVIFHFGEYSRVENSVDDYQVVIESNLCSLHSILQYCQSWDSKLIYAGSSTKFAVDTNESIQTPYSFSKRVNTEHVQLFANLYGLKHAIVYFYNVYGPGEISSGKYSTVIAKFLKLKQHQNWLPVTSPGTQRRNFTHIDDVVAALIKVAECGNGDGFGIGADTSYSILDIVELMGCEARLTPEKQGNRLDAKLITSKTKALGWEPQKNLKSYLKNIIDDQKKLK
jgi:UDP-glucose 4-epimerase